MSLIDELAEVLEREYPHEDCYVCGSVDYNILAKIAIEFMKKRLTEEIQRPDESPNDHDPSA